ncbi:1-deoxy-D-xylulose-5-phosphate synthase [Bacteroidetes/Chlorobi group bacterium Naka2016]|jgi:1-deoxy-D-xylulose-5-phosphate synthase|nr:MAG: 1-deoxy-D-xylulose-5-phosphate synthase [Bacteroidetes/Chlorobi group bacterium Naka2016]
MEINWEKYKILKSIDEPSDLRKLKPESLETLSEELRNYIIEVVTQVGGHFGANLGVVELTIALHYVFNTPKDKIVWDTGHQGYPHKVLTGRRDLLPTIRQLGGLSGFLKREESEYDVFGAGHASTSISAALGIATARDMLGKDYKVIAVIGDGALTGGLAFEAMNNCGYQKRDIIVIFNDNGISIDPNVSAISTYFNELFSSRTVTKLRDKIWNATDKIPSLGDRLKDFLSRLEGGIKSIVTPGMLFEALGFNYFGPINGHNIYKLIRILSQIKRLKGPILLHVMTEKGKGYPAAENDSTRLHAIGKKEKIVVDSIEKIDLKPKVPSYSDVFGNAVAELMELDNRIVAISAAMLSGTGLLNVSKRFPERVFDVGIAEGHAVTYASGMATQGLLPICAIYSTFLQRAFDQIIHDCALQNLHVVFALDRAGLVGEDGPTHHGTFDLAYLRLVPNMIVTAPKDEQELRNLLYSALFTYPGPVSIRYPRGKAVGVQINKFEPIPLGKWELLYAGSDVAILGVGKMVQNILNARELLLSKGYNPTIVNARFIKPLDNEMLTQIAHTHELIITVEEGTVVGGFGSAVAEFLSKNNFKNDLHIIGIPDRFIEHGTQDELLAMLKLDPTGIASQVEYLVEKRTSVLNK